MNIYEDIKQIKGIGDKTSAYFNKLGIKTINDLITTYPRTYVEFPPITKLNEGADNEYGAFLLTCIDEFISKKGKRISLLSGKASDGNNIAYITYFNASYLKKELYRGAEYVFYGRLKIENNRYILDQPQMFSLYDYNNKLNVPEPVYPLTKGLTNKIFIKAVRTALEDNEYTAFYKEYLPEQLIKEFGLCSLNNAIYNIHFPNSVDEAYIARKRLSFDELLIFLYSLRTLNVGGVKEESPFKLMETAVTSRLIEALPYRLTKAQLSAFNDIKEDLTSGYLMNRMIQGDVGSGKTIIAFLSLLLCIDNGYQGALMAPTELLAVQHYENISKLKDQYNLNISPVLLTGAITAKNKREIYENIKNGVYNLIIGTHAIIQENVDFNNLALVVTDEQHRFGVRQRQTLNQKGNKPHVLVMSATPIPRSLSMVLYGDMHLSIIDEKPSMRLPIKNCVVNTAYRPKAYDFILNEIKNKHQVYIICPMIEESEELSNVIGVIKYAEKLKDLFPPNINIGILHGDMKPINKRQVMENFASGNIDILVSTTVIEVGIDVPNATVMMIENAERFGLAQLHQLRGRIGRGDTQSYCIFINCDKSAKHNKRLDILNKTNDGFAIAKEDLKLRGAGDIFGIRQSGQMDFKIADIYDDADMILKISTFLDEFEENNILLSENDRAMIMNYLNENKDKFVDFSSI